MDSRKDSEDTFERVVSLLREHEYSVAVQLVSPRRRAKYKFASVVGRDIRAYFAPLVDDHKLAGISGMIVADNARCYNTIRQCPIQLPLPSRSQEAELLDMLGYLASENGYRLSNNFEFPITRSYLS